MWWSLGFLCEVIAVDCSDVDAEAVLVMTARPSRRSRHVRNISRTQEALGEDGRHQKGGEELLGGSIYGDVLCHTPSTYYT